MLAQQSADQCGWGTGQVSAPYRRGWALGLVLWRGANANALLVQNIDGIQLIHLIQCSRCEVHFGTGTGSPYPSELNAGGLYSYGIQCTHLFVTNGKTRAIKQSAIRRFML